MILNDIEKYVREKEREGLIYPQYEGYCFSNIPAAVQYLFGLRKTSPLSAILNEAGITPSDRQRVVVLLLDAFSWSQWLRYADSYEFLNRLTERGVLAPLTSIFPSITPVAMTTIHCGLTPQEHGVAHTLGYFEEIDQIISTIHFRPRNGDRRDQLLESGVSPHMMFDDVTLYEKLRESGKPSFVLTHDSIKNTAFASVTTKGSTVVPYIGVPGLTEMLCYQLTEHSCPAYFLAYWGIIDIACHSNGVHSEQYLSVIDPLFSALQEDFIDKLPRRIAEETVLLVIADHGHINFEPENTIYLNEYPEVTRNLRTGPAGKKIQPWGGPRAMFLAVEESRLDETIDLLIVELKGEVKVLRSIDALKEGLFGTGNLHPRFRSRIGDIILMPEENLTIWYLGLHDKKLSLVGTHGGLSPDEMLVPFAAARISDLQ